MVKPVKPKSKKLYSKPPFCLEATFLLDYGNGDTPYGGTLEVSTPERSTLYMLGIGLAMILGFVFLRKNWLRHLTQQ